MDLDTTPMQGPTFTPPREANPLVATLCRLAFLLEKAEGPSRDMDWAIHCRNGLDGVGSYGNHPAYTASFDAALTLVPPHYQWEARQGIEARAIVWSVCVDYDEREAPTGYSTTFPAMALCTAALRAQAESIRP
jgi:hypothetical protein